MKRTTLFNLFGQVIKLDWPVAPITSSRTAERMNAGLGGMIICDCAFNGTCRRFIIRKINQPAGAPFKTYQVWGGAGTYAQGIINPDAAVVFTGDANDVWNWLWESGQVSPYEGSLTAPMLSAIDHYRQALVRFSRNADPCHDTALRNAVTGLRNAFLESSHV